MMKKYYSFAGVALCIETEDGTGFEDGHHLAAFRAEEQSNCHSYCLRSVPQLDPPQGTYIYSDNKLLVYSHPQGTIFYHGNISGSWENANLRVDHRGLEHTVQLSARLYPHSISEKAVLSALGAEELVARAGGIILHASYIVWNGMGILFTAPSETGKSTQADLWHKHRSAQIVNGDRAVVRVVNGTASAWGLPFAGSSAYCHNITAPLAAIVYLSQAKETTIQQVSGYQAFRRVWEGINLNRWDPTNVALVSQTAEQLLRQVPVYHLACTPDETAVAALEQMLIK